MTNTFRVFVKDQADPIRVQAGGFLINPSFPPITFTTDQERRHPIDINTISGHEKFTKDNLLAVSIEQNDPSMKKLTIILSNQVSFKVQADSFSIISPPDLSQIHDSATIATLMAMGYQQGSIGFNKDPITTWVAPDALAEAFPKIFRVFVKDLPAPILIQADRVEIQDNFNEPIRFIDDHNGVLNTTISLSNISSGIHFNRNNLLGIAIELAQAIELLDGTSMKLFSVEIKNKPIFFVQAKDVNKIPESNRTNLSGSVISNPQNRVWIESHSLVEVLPNGGARTGTPFVGVLHSTEQESLDNQQEYRKCE